MTPTTMQAAVPSITQRLAVYLAQQSAKGQPFDWAGRHCCHFAAGWVQVLEGGAPLAGLPVEVRDAFSAQRCVRQMGGTLAAAVGQQLRRRAIVPAQAQVGDLVLVNVAGYLAGQGGTGQALGVCAGRTAVFLGADGASVHMPMSLAVAAWPVGRSA